MPRSSIGLRDRESAALVSITVFGSSGEVGGNQILVEGGCSRILLDFGSRMSFDSTYFSNFLNPRTNTELRDRLTLGALPVIPGIYNQRLFEPAGAELLSNDRHRHILTKGSRHFGHSVQTYGEWLAMEGKPFAEALFVSHAHLDHVGAIGYLDTAIPLYCTKDTKTVIETIDEILMFKTEALESKVPYVAFYKKEGLEGIPKIAKEGTARNCFTMADGETRNIGGMRVTLVEVDHSVPGAASYIIETENKRILYTGDIRFHGTKPMTVDAFAARIGHVDLMICEGTRIDSDKKLTEKEIELRIAEKVSTASGLVLVDFGWKDTTRYETVRDAAKKASRTLVINARLARLLYRLGTYPAEDELVRVFLKRHTSALYSPKDYDGYELGLPDSPNCHYENGALADEIRANPGEYVMMFSYYDLGQLFDIIDDDGKLPGSWFIKAQCEPFSDEMEIDEERLIEWLKKFGIGFDAGGTPVPPDCANPSCEKLRERIDRSHVSGHASRPELKELIAKVAPKVLVPIHTNHPEMFAELAREIADSGGPKIRVEVPEYGKPITA
ncbi:MAG: MBL fold metallo-hydrolase [Methanobacteriota archaeon]